jgi:HAD superfamily hydrolase (TIGR01509 family)
VTRTPGEGPEPSASGFDALIFDFDGLIVDTETPAYEAWRQIYAAHGFDLTLAEWVTCIGTDGGFDPYAVLESRFGHDLDRHALDVEFQRIRSDLVVRQPLLAGVKTYLADARRLGMRTGVASNSTRDWVVPHLTRLGLVDRFDAIRCGDDVPCGKPEPFVYKAVLGALGVPPNRAIALEDSPNGVLSAVRAGLLCVAIPGALTADLDFGRADLRLGSLADLPLADLLDRLRGQAA